MHHTPGDDRGDEFEVAVEDRHVPACARCEAAAAVRHGDLAMLAAERAAVEQVRMLDQRGVVMVHQPQQRQRARQGQNVCGEERCPPQNVVHSIASYPPDTCQIRAAAKGESALAIVDGVESAPLIAP